MTPRDPSQLRSRCSRRATAELTELDIGLTQFERGGHDRPIAPLLVAPIAVGKCAADELEDADRCGARRVRELLDGDGVPARITGGGSRELIERGAVPPLRGSQLADPKEDIMSNFPALFASVATLAFGTTAAFAAEPAKANDLKLTKTQCETLWSQALAGSKGDLSMDKAKPYATDFKKADTNSDSKLSATEWMDACNKGLIKTAALSNPGTKPATATSDRTPGSDPARAPGASNTGAAGTEAAKTPGGTSDRTPPKQ